VVCTDDVRLGAGVDFNLGGGYHQSLRPHTRGRISLSPGVWIEQGCVLWAFDGHIVLHPSVFLGPYVVIYGHGGVEIGERTLVAMHCCIVSSNHAVPPVGVILRDQPDVTKPTRIGRDCWLGAGVKVLAGVTLGEGCVIGAGSVVTKDIPAHAIAHGVPARVTGWRDGAAPK
jgi:acetyltransferase-like isoleucine patch superfamily enzyme